VETDSLLTDADVDDSGCKIICRHEMQHRTNQLAKDTGTFIKDLNKLSSSQHSLEPVTYMPCVHASLCIKMSGKIFISACVSYSFRLLLP